MPDICLPLYVPAGIEYTPQWMNIPNLASRHHCILSSRCSAASGKADLGILINSKPWDFAAGALIVEEAGGKVTDFNGNKWNINSNNIVSSNNKFHDKIIELLS